MASTQRDRVIGVEVEVAIGLEVGAPKAQQAIPGMANLRVEAAAHETTRGCLHGGLQRQPIRHLITAVGANAVLPPQRHVPHSGRARLGCRHAATSG